MVIIPVDADEDIAQQVAEKSRDHGTQARQRGFVRDAQIEHHDRDEDGDHAIAESFEPSFAHILNVYALCTPSHHTKPRKIRTSVSKIGFSRAADLAASAYLYLPETGGRERMTRQACAMLAVVSTEGDNRGRQSIFRAEEHAGNTRAALRGKLRIDLFFQS